MVTTKSQIGSKAGQQISVLKSIKSILGIMREGMTEGGAKVAHAVTKELLQNADDAGAAEVKFCLDERTPPQVHSTSDLFCLSDPALLVCNDAAFQTKKDVANPDDLDDFTAILEVASEHKIVQLTAAGKFGIGFNSVYFLSDNPILFSRQEVHVFDLLNTLYEANGWRYLLDDFQKDIELSALIDWCFPAAAIGPKSFAELCRQNADYDKTVFRFPLRNTDEKSKAVFPDRFPDKAARAQLLEDMIREATRSLIFLKNVRKISFDILSDEDVHAQATIEASPVPSKFGTFLKEVESNAAQFDELTDDPIQTSFNRTISTTRMLSTKGTRKSSPESTQTIHYRIYHRGCFEDPTLLDMRKRLKNNQERAVPWVSIAVPLTTESMDIDSRKAADWRVVLPLLEEGPSKCIFSGAFFVGPSRQRLDYRRNENDQGERRTRWNQLLVQKGLVPLLQSISVELKEDAREFISNSPGAYLSLFPEQPDEGQEDKCLADHLRKHFAAVEWHLSLPDIWGEIFSLVVGESNEEVRIEFIPEWLYSYKDRFKALANKRRHFIRRSVGNLLENRVASCNHILLSRSAQADTTSRVLRHEDPPNSKDLDKLLKALLEEEPRASALGGAWSFIRATDTQVIRYERDKLYIISNTDSIDPLLVSVQNLNLPSENIEWVQGESGLPVLFGNLPVDVDNLVKPDRSACLHLFRALPQDNATDLVSDPQLLDPVVSFLVSQPPANLTADVKLGFLVITNKDHLDRRSRGVILLPPKEFDADCRGIWKLWFQQHLAAVDESCVPKLHQILKKHANALDLMSSATCKVMLADWQNVIPILTAVRITSSGTFKLFSSSINQSDDELAERVSMAILSDAERHWERLSDDDRITVLSLPIHRRADGSYISLCGANEVPKDLPHKYKLQADEDLKDAPIQLPNCTLLQVTDPAIKHFYKKRLGLVSQDIAFVLNETLKQVGRKGDYPENKKLLCYIATHIKDAFEKEYRADLRKSLSEANIVPCIDNCWRVPNECAQAWEIYDVVTLQGWPRDQVEPLMSSLFPGENIAKFDPDLKTILPRIQDIQKKEKRDIVKQAVQSPSSELSFNDRLKLITKNLPEDTIPELAIPEVIKQMEIQVLNGIAFIKDCEIFTEQIELTPSVIKSVVPNAVDMNNLSREWKLKQDELIRLLQLFGLQKLTRDDFNYRLAAELASIWSRIARADRAKTVSYINKANLAQLLAENNALNAIALSLPEFATDCPLETYKLLADICDQSEIARSAWDALAANHRVFLDFREVSKFHTSKQMFLGNSKYGTDLSKQLVRLRSTKFAPKEIEPFYKSLGLPQGPRLDQVIAAMSCFAGPTDATTDASYLRLLDALEDLSADDAASIETVFLGAMKIVNCKGVYERIDQCYWDSVLGRANRVNQSKLAHKLVDLSNDCSKRFLSWLSSYNFACVRFLRGEAQLVALRPPTPNSLSPAQETFVSPWRKWLTYAHRKNSALRSDLLTSNFNALKNEVRLVSVDNLKIRAEFTDGQSIEQNYDWIGPAALLVSPQLIYVQPRAANSVEQFDLDMISEISRLLLPALDVASTEKLREKILSTLERPTTLLRQLREKYRTHFLHQYQNEVTDPEFAELFDEYQRLDKTCPESKELEDKMLHRLEQNYVTFRWTSIRSFGYDEASVYAELIQNAEDAYIQRDALKMPMPKRGFVNFRTRDDQSSNVRTLEFEHGGRPFNCWQYGEKEDKTFSRDVEGVLRSSGSFKPHGTLTNDNFDKTIGKFGLGFKSVFLLTDRPEIHSGDWHFAIESGCLPVSLPPLNDLPIDNTMIRLPLRSKDLAVSKAKLLSTLPFLRMITKLDFSSPPAVVASFETLSAEILKTNDALVERVEIHCKDGQTTSRIQFLRVRDLHTQAQMAVLLNREQLPTVWRESFDSDLYASLPLRSSFEAAVAVSHTFEVQSGRTHLVDPEKNKARFMEIAHLVKPVPQALFQIHEQETRAEALTKFWTMWKWDRGDSECYELRRIIATALADLALEQKVIPTQDGDKCLSFRDGVSIYFGEIPDLLSKELMAAGVTIEVEGFQPITLKQSNVIAEGVATCYKKLCDVAQRKPPKNLVRVGWKEVESAFQSQAWLAEKPNLLSILGRTSNDDLKYRLSQWLSKCLVLGQTSSGRTMQLLPGQLFRHKFPFCELLPARFVSIVSNQYDDYAINLLCVSGLKPGPTDNDLVTWLGSELTTAEAIGLLKYLSAKNNFERHYKIKEVFRTVWFPIERMHITCLQAKQMNLLPQEVLSNEDFMFWLGLATAQPTIPPPRQAVHRDPRTVLTKLASWWDSNSSAYITEYENRLYPGARAPKLRKSFTNDAHDRQQWLTLFLLGVFHKMGRTQYEQHREFLSRCERKNWWSVLTDANASAEQWIGLLESYLDDEANQSHDYHAWVGQFVSIYQLSRWLPEYVGAFLQIEKFDRPFHLSQITNIRTSEHFSGSSFDAPTVEKTLGIGACFVMRELTRLKVIKQPHAYPYCFVPLKRTRDFFEFQLNCEGIYSTNVQAYRSKIIHDFLVKHLGQERATFAGAFDLAIQGFLENPEAQTQICGEEIIFDDSGE